MWEAIAAIGELTGAVAVVVGLVYLANQVRGGSQLLERTVQATRTQNSQSVCESFDRWRSMVLDADNADLWFRGVNDYNGLTREDKIRFAMMAGAFDWACWFMYQLQRNEGLMADVNQNIWQDLFKHPGFREWMIGQRKHHSDDFGDFLDQVRESVGDARYLPGETSSLMPGPH